MSVKHALLALLQRGPAHGYRLKVELEDSMGPGWTLNIGQVYTTLGRLERDRLVRHTVHESGRRVFALTSDGKAELSRWFSEPLRMDYRANELLMKLAMAVSAPDIDVATIIEQQQADAQNSLAELAPLSANADQRGSASLLGLEAERVHVEAELDWLEYARELLTSKESPDP